jgi:hypothetical protein
LQAIEVKRFILLRFTKIRAMAEIKYLILSLTVICTKPKNGTAANESVWIQWLVNGTPTGLIIEQSQTVFM